MQRTDEYSTREIEDTYGRDLLCLPTRGLHFVVHRIVVSIQSLRHRAYIVDVCKHIRS